MLKTQHIRAADAVTAGSGGRFHSSAVLGERKVPKEELNFPLQKLEQKEQIRPKGGKIQKKTGAELERQLSGCKSEDRSSDPSILKSQAKHWGC